MNTIIIVLQSLLVAYYLFSGAAKIIGAKYWADIFQHLQLSQRFRVITGIVQLVGAAALITGYWITWAAVLAGAWLSVTMLIACLVHIRARDPFGKTAPALVFAVLNLYLVTMLASNLSGPF